MANIAIIPARGGSKRIPNKNIRDFCGAPLISYSINAAKASQLFDDIIVSTDCQEIADIAMSLGATVPFMRDASLADDHTGTQPVIKHAIEALLKQDFAIDNVCCIYATAPLIQASALIKGYELLQSSANIDYAFSATTFDFPIMRGLVKKEDGGVVPAFPESIGKRSQDLDDVIHDAGQFYWGRAGSFIQNKPVFSEHSRVVNLPRHLVQDIDTPEDWHRAELLYKVLELERGLDQKS